MICDAVVASRAPFLEAWRIRRLYKEVWCRLCSILGLTLLRNCLEGRVKACVYPRSSSVSDWRGGLVEVDARLVAVEGVGVGVGHW